MHEILSQLETRVDEEFKFRRSTPIFALSFRFHVNENQVVDLLLDTLWQIGVNGVKLTHHNEHFDMRTFEISSGVDPGQRSEGNTYRCYETHVYNYLT